MSDRNNTRCMTIDIKPTTRQRQILNTMLRVTNHTHNWCLHLVQMGVPVQKLKNMVLHAADVDEQYRLPNDEWFFTSNMYEIKVTAYQCFRKKIGSNIKRRDSSEYIAQGSIGVEKQSVRYVHGTEDCPSPRSQHIFIFEHYFMEPLRVSCDVKQLPPFNRKFRIAKRAFGRFVLQLMYQPSVRDSNKNTTRVGVETGRSEGFSFVPIVDKITEAYWHLSQAKKNKKKRAIEDRTRELKKLYSKGKIFLDRISHLPSDQSHLQVVPVNAIHEAGQPAK